MKKRSCSKCNILIDKHTSYSEFGCLNPRGRHCKNCARKNIEWEIKNTTTGPKINKLKIELGENWFRDCFPYDFEEELLIESNGRCIYCEFPVKSDYIEEKDNEKYRKMNIDHLQPTIWGGVNGFQNCVISCYHCNSKKGDVLFDEWLKTLPKSAFKRCLDIYQVRYDDSPSNFRLIKDCLHIPKGQIGSAILYVDWSELPQIPIKWTFDEENSDSLRLTTYLEKLGKNVKWFWMENDLK